MFLVGCERSGNKIKIHFYHNFAVCFELESKCLRTLWKLELRESVS